MDIVFEKTKHICIRRNNIVLYNGDDALTVIKLCENNNLMVYGIDAFKLYPNGRIQPFMEFSPEYSCLSAKDSWDASVKFLDENKNKEFMCEIVYKRT